MELMQVLQDRRSIRKYKDTPIEDDKLAAVAESFRIAPSAGNGQGWKLIVVKDPAVREKIANTTLSKPAWLLQAPVILVACGTRQNVMTNNHRVDTVDVSIAFTQMILAAWDLGLGTCWMASYREDWMLEALDLDDSYSVVAITPLGYADESPAAKPRKDTEVVVEYR